MMMTLDDLDTTEVGCCLLGKPHHENGADREVGHDETTRSSSPQKPQGFDPLGGEARGTDYRIHTSVTPRLEVGHDDIGSVDSKTTSPTTAWSVVIERLPNV